MSKLAGLRKLFKFVPKKALVAAGIIAAVVVPFAVGAYGPERPTYTMENPADHVTFNSITNNPHGDERNFVSARDANTGNNGINNIWNADSITVQNGHEYYISMYVHNNASANLNLVAENVTAKFNVPTATATSQTVSGTISSSNATPKEVWDSVVLKSDIPFNLDYIEGSAYWETNGAAKGALPDSTITSGGTKLGYNALDGRIPGCFQYDGFLTFKVRPQFASTFDFTASKQVSKHDAKAWGEDYVAQPGELVDFRVDYINVSGEQQNNVTLRDDMPAGLTVQSVRWYNLATGAWQNAVGDITTTGINIGSYINKGTQTRAEIVAKVPELAQLACGVNKFTNTGSVTVNGWKKSDTASVTVNKDCTPPIEKCTVPGKTHLDKNDPNCKEDKEKCTVPGKTHLDKDDPNCKEDKEKCTVPGKEHLDKDDPNCKQDKEKCAVPGKTHLDKDDPNCKEDKEKCTVPGKTHLDKDDPNCKEDITPVAICRMLIPNKTVTKVGEGITFRVYPEKFGNVTVDSTWMNFGDGVITTPLNTLDYAHTYTKAGNYTAKVFINFTVEGASVDDVTSVDCEVPILVIEKEDFCKVPGKEHLPLGDPNCKTDIEMCKVPGKENLPLNDPRCKTDQEMCKVPGKEYLPAGDPKCKTDTTITPPPKELPKTGAEMFGVVGLGSIVTSLGYFITSRKRLGKV